MSWLYSWWYGDETVTKTQNDPSAAHVIKTWDDVPILSGMAPAPVPPPAPPLVPPLTTPKKNPAHPPLILTMNTPPSVTNKRKTPDTYTFTIPTNSKRARLPPILKQD